MWETVIMGAITVIVLIAFQRGVAGWLGDLFDRLTGKRGGAPPSLVEPELTAIGRVKREVASGLPLLEVSSATRSFGNLRAVDDQLHGGARIDHRADGPNGAGKTMLNNSSAGTSSIWDGQICRRSIETLLLSEIAGLGIGRTFQNLQLFGNMTVLENVMCGRYRLQSAGILAVAANLPRVRRDEDAVRHAAVDCLRFVGLQGAERLMATELSFGHMRLVEIARALALEPSLLLMDEPGSGLNDTETERLAELIAQIRAAPFCSSSRHAQDGPPTRSSSCTTERRLPTDHRRNRNRGLGCVSGHGSFFMKALLELKAVCSGYGSIRVLDKVTLEVRPGEIVALIGANGAGKSTLLNTVMGLIPLSDGDIRLDGSSIANLSTAAIVRSGIAQVPERRQLFGPMTIEENLRLGAFTLKDRAGLAACMEEQFEQFPILRERRTQSAQTLSGGEQQMVAIARAMMSRPRLLLLDEPSLGLAPLMVARILDQITRLRAAGGTILVVEQNARAALGIADRGYVLENGVIAAQGEAQALLHNAAVQDAYLGGSGGSVRAMEQRIRQRRREIISAMGRSG
jgi:ABC-type branched-subunit amino acid transport system ATPase component